MTAMEMKKFMHKVQKLLGADDVSEGDKLQAHILITILKLQVDMVDELRQIRLALHPAAKDASRRR